jgi:hypothetical protein
MKKYFIVYSLLIFFILLNISQSLKASVKNIRNLYQKCSTEYNCQECTYDGQYKKCSEAVCYCCDLDEKCRAQY